MTVGEALQFATRSLKEAGLRTPREDAEYILTAVLKWTRADLLTHPEHHIEEVLRRSFLEWLERRRRHYPLQYMKGVQEFYGREFVVTPEVLVPRPETEQLVEFALELLASRPDEELRVLEIGSGSGCLGLSILCENSGVRLTATDISADALRITRLNARRLGCARRLETVCGDALQPLEGRKAAFSLLVSNPPYGALVDEETVDLGVRLYEPRRAVFAGATGLELYRSIFRHAAPLLRPGAEILLEMGAEQAAPVSELARDHGWEVREIRRDLAGIERCARFGRIERMPPKVD